MMVWKIVQRAGTAVSGGASAEQDEKTDVDILLDDKSDIIGAMAPAFEQPNVVFPFKTRLTEAVRRLLVNKSKGQKTSKLLFGATGLVGSHLLHYLLKVGAPKVHCIVRAAHTEAAYQRVESTLRRLNLWRPCFTGRSYPCHRWRAQQAGLWPFSRPV